MLTRFGLRREEHQHLTDRVSPNNNRRRRKDVDRSNLTCRGIPSTKCCSLTSASGSRRNKLDRSSDCERCKRDRLTESNTICLESCSRVLIDNVECKSEEEGDCCRRCCFVVGSSKSDLKTIRDDKRSDLATQREMRDVQVVVDRDRKRIFRKDLQPIFNPTQKINARNKTAFLQITKDLTYP